MCVDVLGMMLQLFGMTCSSMHFFRKFLLFLNEWADCSNLLYLRFMFLSSMSTKWGRLWSKSDKMVKFRHFWKDK